jgi:hypothetical protein
VSIRQEERKRPARPESLKNKKTKSASGKWMSSTGFLDCAHVSYIPPFFDLINLKTVANAPSRLAVVASL